MKTVQLVVCDIDNTLVVKHAPLTPLAKQAIEELKKRGVLFGLASGRSIDMLHILEQEWGIECDLLIGLNGSEIYDGINNTTESYYRMEAEWLKECFEIMSPFKYIVNMRINGINYVKGADQQTLESIAYLKGSAKPHVVEDESEFYSQPNSKVGFRVSAEDMPAIEKRVAQFPSPYYCGFKTENTMFEFCNINASKGKLLQQFVDAHHLDMNKVYAFGDMTNDISMLEAAGVGVCMLNGSEDAKAASQIITDKDIAHDGWADFIFNHLLLQK